MTHEKEEAISELTTGHLAEMKSTKQKHEATIQELNNDFAQQMAKKEEDHAENVAQVTLAHQKELDALNHAMDTLKAELEDLRNKYLASERTVADLEKQLGFKDNQIKSMRDRVAEANAAAEKAQADFHERTVTIEQEY